MTKKRSLIEEPICQFLDQAATGRRASLDDIGELLAEHYPRPQKVTGAEAQRRLARATDQIATAWAAGDRGAARRIARDVAAELADQLGEPTRPDPGASMSAAEVVRSIPRPAA